MDSEVTEELVVGPADDAVAERLADAPGWEEYSARLRDTLWKVVKTTGVESLEVADLRVPEPLPTRHSSLRNGVELDLAGAIKMVVDMLAGVSPYCDFTAPGLHIAIGYNGYVNIYMTRGSADKLADLGREALRLQWCNRVPDFPDDIQIVEASADDSFWTSIRSAAETAVVLLCERWAHGDYGCNWFLLNPDNIDEICQSVQPRSLLCVAIDPDLHLNPALKEEDFTAFRAPLTPGRLTYAAHHWGVDDLQELVDQGMNFMVATSDLRELSAVVPDADGVVRGVWMACTQA
ncbi:hypothetical protein [Nonomuraea sp. LPB2021202275-12-8]|uniref:hypothetical protein n=1 Tax=Nonomuraea sp. LPB2021202275-12-8 TaxID=3120159 RepID=UPI00300D6060